MCWPCHSSWRSWQKLDRVISMEILPVHFWKSWISNKGVSMIIISTLQLIYLKFYLSVLPIHSTLSSPLLDRCEIVHLAGYMFNEKVAIANRFLVPKQIGMNGLKKQYAGMSEETLREIVTEWTREAGVRSLERVIAGVARFKAV